MKPRLAFLDIDGTLTPAGSNVPPESAMHAIHAAQAAGHRVFLCTGRNPDMLAPVLSLGFDSAVSCAGGYVFSGNRVLYDHPMPDADFDIAMRLLKEDGVFRTIEALDATFGDENLPDSLFQKGAGNSELVRWRRVLAERLNIRPMEEYDGRPVYKIVFMCAAKSSLKEPGEPLTRTTALWFRIFLPIIVSMEKSSIGRLTRAKVSELSRKALGLILLIPSALETV